MISGHISVFFKNEFNSQDKRQDKLHMLCWHSDFACEFLTNIVSSSLVNPCIFAEEHLVGFLSSEKRVAQNYGSV